MRLAIVVIGFLALSTGRAKADGMPSTSTAAPTKRHNKKVSPPKVSLSCKTDDDCGTTRMAAGDCCPSLCQPRVVSKKSAQALAKYAAVCKKPEGGECPVSECAPPQAAVVAACVSGKCEAHAMASPSRE